MIHTEITRTHTRLIVAGWGPHSTRSEEEEHEEASRENLARSRDNSVSAAIWMSEELLSRSLCITLGLAWRMCEPEKDDELL